MKTTVQKWGNSLAIRIPKHITKDTNVSEGSTINIMVKDGDIILHPTSGEYSLNEILNKINSENIHSEISTGDQTGGEVW